MRAFSFGLALALGVSAMVHAAVLAFLVERIARPGVEAASEAVSVEIVLEVPPAPLAGTRSAAEPQSASEGTSALQELETPDAPALSEEPAKRDETPQGGPQTTEVPEKPVFDQPPVDSSPPQVANTEQAEPVPSRPRSDPLQAGREMAKAREEPAGQPGPQPKELAEMPLPVENVPIPTSRPEPPKQREAERSQRPARKKVSTQAETHKEKAAATERSSRRKRTIARESPPAKPAGSARRPSTASAGDRKGGATAGEMEAYARRLNRHVQRHRRYPPEAKGISGTVRLAITLDAQGRLRGARISRSSGHAVFDAEAVAAARRAQPYPRPPEGYTGGTNTVSLIFKRR